MLDGLFSLEFGTDGFWNAVIALGIFGILSLCGLLFWLRRQDKPGTGSLDWPKEGEVREVKAIGYDIKVCYFDGIWYSPFRNLMGIHFKFRDIDGLRQSIKTCIKDHKFKLQFDSLFDKKIIVKLNEGKMLPITNDKQPSERRVS